jgi:pullulanase
VSGAVEVAFYSASNTGWWVNSCSGDNNFVIPAGTDYYAITQNSVSSVTGDNCGTGVATNPAPTGISQMNQITLDLGSSAAVSTGSVTVTGQSVTSVVQNGATLTITTAGNLNMHNGYTVNVPGHAAQLVQAGSVVRTAAFDTAYDYSGTDLGAVCPTSGSSPTFKLWAPTASQVKLQVFSSDQSATASLASTTAMSLVSANSGVWQVTLSGKSCADLAYDYLVTFPDGTTNESPDPYAKAAVVNGKRSVLLTDAQTALPGTKAAKPAFDGNPTDAIVAETDVRDFSKSSTSGVSASNQGKYLGMVQTGTKNSSGASTGIDYLKQLGITHIQIMPFYDYGSVDETNALNDSNYNWGYDPINWDVPEGSYASSATNPATRIIEAKEMINGLHQNGLRVVMDAVYNHVYNDATSSFGLTVPGYYFRYNTDGTLVNDSGCGNTTATERGMMRKYILDSVTYWTKTYGVDGFRFDLMGLIDETTMKQVRSTLDAIDPSMLVLGEGWNMSSTLDNSNRTIQSNAYMLDRKTNTSNGSLTGSTVSFFNDSLRDSVMNFSKGNQGQEPLIAHNLLGCQYDGNDNILPDSSQCGGSGQANYSNAAQVTQYVEIHDGYTLYDNLKNGTGYSDTVIEQRAKINDAAVLLGLGQPELQIGQEFLRTKNGDANSFNTGDTENALNWSRQSQAPFSDSVAFFKGLIALRKSSGAFRMSDYNTINSHSQVIAQGGGVVAYELTDPSTGSRYYVILNSNTGSASVSGLPSGTYQLPIYNSEVSTASQSISGTFTAAGLSVNVLRIG